MDNPQNIIELRDSLLKENDLLEVILTKGIPCCDDIGKKYKDNLEKINQLDILVKFCNQLKHIQFKEINKLYKQYN